METLCICAEEITERAIYPCGHSICSRCSLRMRYLMKDNTCPYCRETAENVSVISGRNATAASARIALKKTGIFCETETIKDHLNHLVNMPCPECDKELVSIKPLREHLQKEHQRQLCNVCVRQESLFANEFPLYTPKQLASHMKKDHTYCEFCNWYFYSNDELAKHCRHEHECCFICEREDPRHPQYYSNYEKLEAHFQSAHYMCMVQSCLEDKFVVFGTKMELQSHMLENHRDLVANVREFRKVSLDDDKPKNAKRNSKKKSAQDEAADPSEKELAQRRYNERLKIYAKHDNGKIDQIQQANQTFQTKFVPVDAFVSTYTNVLGASEDEVTLLLQEFKKFTVLDDNKDRSLSNVLSQRAEKMRVAEEASVAAAAARANPKNQKGARNGSPAASAAVAFSAHRRIPVAGAWVGATSGGSLLDTANLPRLGQNNGGNARRPAFMNRPVANIRAAQPAPTRSAPVTRVASPSPSISVGGGPQTRLPALGSRSNRADLVQTVRQQTWGGAGPSWDSVPLPTSRSAVNVGSTGSNLNSRSSSTQSLASASSSTSSLNSANLPRLPQRQPKPKGTGSKRVLRIV